MVIAIRTHCTNDALNQYGRRRRAANPAHLTEGNHNMRYHLIGGLLAAALLSSTAMAQTTTPPQSPASSAKTEDILKGTHWRASKMTGLNVYNDANEKIGDIKELILDKDSKVVGYVIGVGGFLGMGEHDIAVSMDKLKFVEEPVRTSATTKETTTKETTTGAATSTTTTTRAGNANDWTPDHAMMSATKEQLKAMPQFKYSDYN
jgi:sporulation protein YlmC with PRC-barrel domain